MSVSIFLGGYLLIVNLLGFLIMGIDKFKARNHQWRIPESTLFTISWIGGCIGTILGMYTFRHKTKHRTFTIGLPVILCLQLGILLWLLYLAPFDFYTI